MTLQTILYFSSIVLTCILTGFLAWYAWRQPALPGVRTYAMLAFSECLLALAEILSMLSGTQAQALFWFKLRFVFNAIIPILWLVFALEYNGRKDWISNRLLTGIFIIPLATLVILWSDNLHGLWVKQEVSFHQNGPFWIAETSARIPGLWFMVHSFYSLTLLLIGIGVILFTAWRKRRDYGGQALLLSGGALIALALTLIPIFNLMPQAEFNPFIPGIGISAFLYALAIFRYKFLKSASIQKDDSHIAKFDSQEKYSLAIFILTFILFTSGIAAVSYITYQNYERQFRAQMGEQLSAIAELKMNGLLNWRAERMADAESLYSNPVFTALAQRSLENPDDAQAKAQLQNWLGIVQNSYRYDRVFLLDTKGAEWVSAPAVSEPVAKHLTQEIAAILKTRQVTFLDLHLDPPDGAIHLAVLAPIYAEQDQNHPLGLLVLRIDPNMYFYPYINQWPAPSQSAETLLIRRDGEDALFLNPLRFEPDAALNLRIPLVKTETLSVKAVLGQVGMVQGMDYRNVEVIGDIHAVPDSPWFLVSKMDAAEVYAPLRERLWQTFLFFGLLVLVTGVLLTLVWRQQQIRFYRGQVEAAEALRKSQEQYQGLIEHASDGIFIADANGRYLEVNQSGCAMLGYTRDEILSKRISDLVAPEDIAATPLRLDELRQGKTVLSERHLICKDGSLLPVEISGRMLPDGRFQSITRDITERKQAEKELHESRAILQAAMDNSPAGIAIADAPDGKLRYVNNAGLLIRGGDRQSIMDGIGIDQYVASWKILDLDGRPLNPDEVPLARAILFGETNSREFIVRRTSDDDRIVLGNAAPIMDERGKVTAGIVIFTDITERKTSEEALRRSEEKFSIMFRSAPFSAALSSLSDLKLVEVNEQFEKYWGYSSAEVIGKTSSELGLHPDNNERARLSAIFQERGFIHGVESKMKSKSGELKDVLINSDIVRIGNEQFILSTVQNITEGKQTEEALRKSQEQFRIAQDMSPDGFTILQPVRDAHERVVDFTWVYENAAVARLNGTDPEAVVGKRLLELFPGHHGTPILGAYQQVAESGEACILESNYSGESMSKPTSFRIVVVPMAGNIAILAQDITERKQIEDVLQEYNTRLETEVDERTRELRETQEQLVRQERLAALGQLAGSIGHELRNPLGVISNAVYYLKIAEPNASEKVKEYLDMIEKETRASDKIITDLLDFTRIKSLDRQPASVSELIAQTLERYPTPESVETALEIPADLPQVFADPHHVVQILGNLIVNACQSMKDEGRLVISCQSSVKTEVLISVRDTGMGITPENMKKVFEPLFTTKTKGIGLGLAVSRKLAEASGGRLEVESEAGIGSAFTLVLPTVHTK